MHNSLIAGLRRSLGRKLRPRYYVRLEERAYLDDPSEGLVFVGLPDLTVQARGAPTAGASPSRAASRALAVEVPVPESVRETYLVVHAAESGEVVTVLEILSHKNERAGKGRRLYQRKRASVLGSLSSLVEIDLLRAGERMPVLRTDGTADYRILISRGESRPRAQLLLFSLRDAIPRFRLPLRAGDDEPEVDLGGVLSELYDEAAYDLMVDYRSDPTTPLARADRRWAAALVRKHGARRGSA